MLTAVGVSHHQIYFECHQHRDCTEIAALQAQPLHKASRPITWQVCVFVVLVVVLIEPGIANKEIVIVTTREAIAEGYFGCCVRA